MKIVKIPIVNGLNKTSGVEGASEKILENLLEIYSNSCGKPIGNSQFEESRVKITGDLEKDNDVIYKVAFDSFKKEKVMFLGGDHSMSYPTTRAFFDYTQNLGKESALIVFDAHPDLMEPVDRKIPTHEEWLRALIEDGFNSKNILLVGVRNSDPIELDYIKKKGVKVIRMQDLFLNFRDIVDVITEFGYNRETYVSIDIDAVDPAYAPATGYCEPGGASSKEFLYIISRIAKMKTLRAIDLVEINPTKDINDMTSRLGAKIVSEFL